MSMSHVGQNKQHQQHQHQQHHPHTNSHHQHKVHNNTNFSTNHNSHHHATAHHHHHNQQQKQKQNLKHGALQMPGSSSSHSYSHSHSRSRSQQHDSYSRRPDTTVSASTIYGGYSRDLPPKQSRGFLHSDDEISDKASTCGKLLIILSCALVVLTLPFSLFVCFKVVQEYERAVIFRLGRLMQGGAKGPGIFFILPCIDSYARVDLRTRTYDVPPQEGEKNCANCNEYSKKLSSRGVTVLTKDSVTVSVDAVVYYRVSNATVSIANVENAHHSTRLLAQTTLRNTMGTRHLHEILSERMTISGTMQVQLDEATDAWGIKVERVEIKDVRLPVQLQRAMAAEAEAAREARAKVIAAEGEQKASRALREASEVIGDSPAALQLRYLQTLNTISAEKNSTIVFPLPIDLITYFLKTTDAVTQQNSRNALAKFPSSSSSQQLKQEKKEQQLKEQQLKEQPHPQQQQAAPQPPQQQQQQQHSMQQQQQQSLTQQQLQYQQQQIMHQHQATSAM